MASGTHWVSHILQDMTEKAPSSAVAARKVSTAAALYRDRRNVLLAALRARGVEAAREYDGLNVWLPLCREPVAFRQLDGSARLAVRAGTIGFYLSGAACCSPDVPLTQR